MKRTSTSVVVDLSACRAARGAAAGGSKSELLPQQVLRGHPPVHGSRDREEMLVRDRRTVDPLGDEALRNADRGSQLPLATNKLDDIFNSAHPGKISSANFSSQAEHERRFWKGDRASISVANMPTKENKRAKPTQADKEAAKRLHALWKAIPFKDRPTQEEMGADFSENSGSTGQSTVSQYMTGRIPINYRALLIFSKHLECRPEQIRSDLPEQQIESGEPATDADAVWQTYSPEEKALILDLAQMMRRFSTVSPPHAKQAESKKKRGSA